MVVGERRRREARWNEDDERQIDCSGDMRDEVNIRVMVERRQEQESLKCRVRGLGGLAFVSEPGCRGLPR